MSDPWPYIPYLRNFQAFPLGNGGKTYGSVYLYTGPERTLPNTVPSPTQGSGYPPDPGNHSSFPDMFNWLANHIGQALDDMNKALAALHRGTMGGRLPPNPGELGRYVSNANKILVTLRFTGGSNPFWPLVPANNTGNSFYDGYVIQPGQPGPVIVSTLNVPNPAFGNLGKTLDFSVKIAGDHDRDAKGRIVFYQDCAWDAVPPSSTSAWMSWGFVTSFALDLFEPEGATTRGQAKGTSSSSSSSLYAASSAVPIG